MTEVTLPKIYIDKSKTPEENILHMYNTTITAMGIAKDLTTADVDITLQEHNDSNGDTTVKISNKEGVEDKKLTRDVLLHYKRVDIETIFGHDSSAVYSGDASTYDHSTQSGELEELVKNTLDLNHPVYNGLHYDGLEEENILNTTVPDFYLYFISTDNQGDDVHLVFRGNAGFTVHKATD